MAGEELQISFVLPQAKFWGTVMFSAGSGGVLGYAKEVDSWNALDGDQKLVKPPRQPALSIYHLIQGEFLGNILRPKETREEE